MIQRRLKGILRRLVYLPMLPIFFLVALVARFRVKRIDVGLGPEPMINNVYHKKALETYGYTAETFVGDVYFITDQFDVRADKPRTRSPVLNQLLHILSVYYLFSRAVLHYKCLYLYFNGGPLGLASRQLWRFEPLLFKLAKTKVVMMPYGGDVQEMSRSPNLLFKDAMAHDYPTHRLRRAEILGKIDLWTKYADHIISGCEWVDYMYYWDTLMLAHFSIDVDLWKPVAKDSGPALAPGKKIRILHAPNHKAIKGTEYFVNAVNELQAEGLPVELILLQKVPNYRIREVMASVDLVADQLIIGWYAMFALEGMSMEKPVLCYLRRDLENLYTCAGLVEPNEIPIINCSPLTIKDTIRDLVLNPGQLPDIGKRSREYVIKHHSTQVIGKVFDQVNRSIGIVPQGSRTGASG